MDLLNKFQAVNEDNISRIDTSLSETLLGYESYVNLKNKEIQERITYLKNFNQEGVFEEYIDTEIDCSMRIYADFVYKSIDTINSFYQLDLSSRKFIDLYGYKIFSLDDVLSFCFKISKNVPLEKYAISKTKEDLFNRFNNRWKCPLPSVTKSGVITFPKILYIMDGYHSQYLKMDYSNQDRIDLLDKCVNLFFNNENKPTKIFYPLSAMYEQDDKTTFCDYLNKDEIFLEDENITSIKCFSNGNIKLKFKNKLDAFKFFEYFELDKCVPNV